MAISHRFLRKTVLVTGGCGGIGSAIVARFFAEGATVFSIDTQAATPEWTAMLSQLPAPLKNQPLPRVLTCDVTSRAAAEAVVADAASLAPVPPTVLVNNHAAFVFKSVGVASDADWDRVLGANIKGYANTIAASLPYMKRAGGGSIVNVSSVSAFFLQSGFVPYSTSKAAQLHLTRLVAHDEGRHNVRVNAVAPGFIFTEGTKKHAAGVGQTVQRVCDEMARDTIMKRMGTPIEVANAVAFLASEEASFITGATLSVDGGTYPR